MQKKTEKKPSTLQHAGAGAVALAVTSPITKLVKAPITKVAMSAFDNIGQYNDQFKRTAELAFNGSGLASKGVSYVNAANLTNEQITDCAKKVLPKWTDKLPKTIKEKLNVVSETIVRTIKSGGNAAFVPNSNQILVNTEKMSAASLHEMGHALNKFSKIGKILQKCRPIQLLALPILAVAAFKPKKADGEKANGVIDKTTTFIKNNAGKLTFATFLPILVEEGMASIKGAKLAKPHLSADMLKQLNKLNGKAFLTYLGVAVATSLTATAASWIHDKIVSAKK